MKNNENIAVEIAIEDEKWLKKVKNIKKKIINICYNVIEDSKILDFTKGVEVSFLLTNDIEMQKVNNKFRNIDKPTNVLSFPLSDINFNDYSNLSMHDNEVMIGDIALSYDTINREAYEQNKNFDDHLTHMTIHGILHLLGYDHVEDYDANIMENKEIKLLEKMNICNPYA